VAVLGSEVGWLLDREDRKESELVNGIKKLRKDGTYLYPMLPLGFGQGRPKSGGNEQCGG